jgi:hypothetical protein
MGMQTERIWGRKNEFCNIIASFFDGNWPIITPSFRSKMILYPPLFYRKTQKSHFFLGSGFQLNELIFVILP